jgi:hypothetical protein
MCSDLELHPEIIITLYAYRHKEAIERFVNLASIALGLLQSLSLTQAAAIGKIYPGWLRTYSSAVPSESLVQAVVRAEFFSSLGKVPTCRTLRLIQERMVGPPSLNLTA